MVTKSCVRYEIASFTVQHDQQEVLRRVSFKLMLKSNIYDTVIWVICFAVEPQLNYTGVCMKAGREPHFFAISGQVVYSEPESDT